MNMAAEFNPSPPGLELGKQPPPQAEPTPATSEKDRLIKSFLKSLKVMFKTASIYNGDHPAFIKAVTEIKEKVESLLELLSPLAIGFSSDSVLVDGRFWQDEKAHAELGRLFHLRKVKSLAIHHGVTLDELTRFASRITLALPEFVKQGGAHRMLATERFGHIGLEILDYSQLLRGEGEEIKDIWPYLLMEAVEEENPEKIDLVAGSFAKVIGRFNTEDLIQNEELQKNFLKFFKCLRETSEEKHRRCARDLLKSVLRVRKATEDKFENLKLLISDLSEEDLASTLWEEIIGNERFDSLSFSVFSRLVSKEKHKRISTSLRDLFQTDDPANRRAEVERKIKALLKGTSGPMVSEIYRQTLTELLTEIRFEKKTDFDRPGIERNYRYLMLNLLVRTDANGSAPKHLERILEEWEHIGQDKDLDFLACLQEALGEYDDRFAGEPAFETAGRQLSGLVEGWVLAGETGEVLDRLVTGLDRSLFEPEVYLDAIFKARTVTSTLLRACLRLFGGRLDELRARLKKYSSASDLLGKIAGALERIDTPVAFGVLKDIYAAGDGGVKVRVLQAMQKLTEHDEPFLFGVLEARDRRLKAEALVLLARHPRARHVALTKLLGLQSPYGTRNRKLTRHIRIVEEKGVREAREFLEPLGRRRDFWNRTVRHEALRVLEAWHEG